MVRYSEMLITSSRSRNQEQRVCNENWWVPILQSQKSTKQVLNCVNKLRSPILVLDFPRSGESSGGGLAPHHWHFSHPVFVMTGLRVTEVPFVKYRTIELFTCQGTYGRFLDFDGRKTSFYLVADEKGHFVALQAIL